MLRASSALSLPRRLQRLREEREFSLCVRVKNRAKSLHLRCYTSHSRGSSSAATAAVPSSGKPRSSGMSRPPEARTYRVVKRDRAVHHREHDRRRAREATADAGDRWQPSGVACATTKNPTSLKIKRSGSGTFVAPASGEEPSGVTGGGTKWRPRVDSHDVGNESAVRSAENPRRTLEARHRRQSRPCADTLTTGARRPRLAHVPRQSRRSGRGCRFLHRTDPHVRDGRIHVSRNVSADRDNLLLFLPEWQHLDRIALAKDCRLSIVGPVY
jgi:hypothetical protein